MIKWPCFEDETYWNGFSTIRQITTVDKLYIYIPLDIIC